MGNLRSGIVIQCRVARSHSSKQGNVYRRIFLQSLFEIIFVCCVPACKSGNFLCLPVAHKKQRICLFDFLFFFRFQADSGCIQRICRFLQALLFIERSIYRLHFLCNQLHNIFRAVSQIIFRKHAPEFLSHGMLPRLRRNSRSDGTAVDSGLGASCVITIDTAGRNGLQHMKININTHCFSPFST